MASLALVCACLFLGAISALEARHVSVAHGVPLGWSSVLGSAMPRWILLAALLPFVLRLAMKWPLVPVRTPFAAVHLAVFLVLSVSQAVVSTWALGLASPMSALMFGFELRAIRTFYESMPTMVSVYGAVVLAAWGMAEARERQRRTLRASQLEAQLQTARLAALRAQLQPHFLYNTLNGISALVSDLKPARAVEAIEQLSELLHASLRDDAREEITVEEELALARRYLALQGMRFGDRLQYDLRMAPTVAGFLVPVLLIQPIIENAVVHGLDSGDGTLHISIAALETGNGVELRVENDGSAPSANGARGGGEGLGLSLTRARLSTAYGDRATLSLLPREGRGVVVRMLLPRFPHNAAATTATSAVALKEPL